MVAKWGEGRHLNVNNPERHILAQELPLATPYSVMIEPTNLCNFRCNFCPTGQPDLLKKINRPKGSMSPSLFQKIIKDISFFPSKLKVLNLHKDGEPLVNSHLSEMISSAVSQEVADSVALTTNGALLTAEKSKEILKAGIDVIRVSVEHVSDEKYKKITQTFGDYNKIVNNVSSLFNERNKLKSKTKIWVKIINFDLSNEEINKFENDFKSICDEYLITTPVGWSRTELYDFTLGSAPRTSENGETELRPSRIVCPYPFYSMAINFDGSVCMCCVDWSYSTIIGQVTENSLLEIWNGKAANDFRVMHLTNNRHKNSACANCQSIQGFPPESDLDNERERLIKLYL